MNKIFSILIFLIFLFNYIVKLSANDETYINSNNIIYNEKENIVELAENSKINYKNTNILIDRGIIDYNKNEIEVFGNFYLYEELNILSGENLKGNTTLDIFTANNVSFIYNDDLKIDSDKLNRDNNLVYFYNNFLTPCEIEGYFNCPTWSLRVDKTRYDIQEDKFVHFDTFLQIADYKVFYLPYFSHYGAKAPRKRGFLTPTIEFTVGGEQGLILPYYIPLSQSTDILLKPKIYLDQNFEFLERYHLLTLLENKRSGGNTTLSLNTIQYENTEYTNNSLKINTKQVINKNSIFTASGFFTNSISTARSVNEKPITFENIFIKLENYNFFIKNDFLKFELSTIESFIPNNSNTIPISSSINYINFTKLNKSSIMNELDLSILKRDESTLDNPSEGFNIKFNNELSNGNFYRDFIVYNKVLLNNSFKDYYFNKDKSLNHNASKSYLNFSSDILNNNFRFTTPRIKLILPYQLNNTNKDINEDSNSISFSYENQFSENRFFGNDLFDTSPRIVYGFENKIKKDENEISLNINQSFETKSGSTYSEKINQNSKYSDYAIESKFNKGNLELKVDTRLNQTTLSRKEINYSLVFESPIKLSLNYNETHRDAFKDLSSDTEGLDIEVEKNLNDNISLSYITKLDVKNDYDPYKSSLKLSLFDECSQLDIGYTNTRYNDNYNTKPTETISFTFRMDYLGFFGYQQSTDLLFSEPGSINYGL